MMHSVAAAAGVAGAGVAGTVDGEGFLVKKEVILNVPSALSFTSFFSFFSFFGTPSLGPRRTPLSDKGQDETLSRLPFAVCFTSLFCFLFWNYFLIFAGIPK
jgi:hypothetical protein